MRIDIWSDVVCPWCFLGKRRLARALASLPWRDEVVVRWRAFQLDPRATSEPRDLREAIDRKYGPGGFDRMDGRLTDLGRAEGIAYRFDRALRVGTFDAHRLLAWAWEAGGGPAQDRLQERLFRAYFEEGANVADHDVLAGFASETGLDPDEASRVLATGGHAADVADDLRMAEERQLTGVPAFVIEDRVLVPGAQEAETFIAVLERSRQRFGT